MSELTDSTSRRTFLAVSSLAGMALPYVHAAGNDTIQLALIGCGGRGTGAAENALGIKNGPIKLVAMADVFPQKLSDSHGRLRGRFASQMDVPQDRQFIGFDGFRKAMDSLKPGDVAILATPPAFRWVHFRDAIDKGLNVFMEKPVTVDGPDHAAHDRARRRSGPQEPEGRRRPDGAPLPRPAGTPQPHSRRPDRRHRRHARLSHGIGAAAPCRSSPKASPN